MINSILGRKRKKRRREATEPTVLVRRNILCAGPYLHHHYHLCQKKRQASSRNTMAAIEANEFNPSVNLRFINASSCLTSFIYILVIFAFNFYSCFLFRVFFLVITFASYCGALSPAEHFLIYFSMVRERERDDIVNGLVYV